MFSHKKFVMPLVGLTAANILFCSNVVRHRDTISWRTCALDNFIANLHIAVARSILFLTMYDENDIGWAKGHLKTGFSVNDWKSSKTLQKNWSGFLDELWFQVGVNSCKVGKLVSRSVRSQSWLCPFSLCSHLCVGKGQREKAVAFRVDRWAQRLTLVNFMGYSNWTRTEDSTREGF